MQHYNAFDEYHEKHNLGAMEKLFAGYLKERLDWYGMINARIGIGGLYKC